MIPGVIGRGGGINVNASLTYSPDGLDLAATK